MNTPIEIHNYKPEDIVKSCSKLEAGLRFGQEGICACALGPFQSPVYWTPHQAASQDITKDMLIKRRREIFDMLNDDHSETPCKGCQMVHEKPFKEVDFSRLGHIDFSETSLCNIRCDYCAYTKNDSFNKSNFDALKVLREFQRDDVLWNSAVDFGGGEPTILSNFDECLDYFESRGTRVFLYTNGAKYSQAAYDGLVKGSISWLCVSLDCGTPSTYMKTKLRDYYPRVMDNLFKYMEASREGYGNVSVKYIFTENNCSDDDVYGFALAMRALQPDKIWLTFDFEPTKGLAADSDDFGEFDYTKLIDAYVKLFMLLKKYGMNPGHFEENHLSQVSRQGQILLDKVREGVAKLEDKTKRSEATEVTDPLTDYAQFRIDANGTQILNLSDIPLDLNGKKVLVAPVSNQSVALVKQLGQSNVGVVGFIDRDPILQSKTIDGLRVMSYQAIANVEADVILLAVHKQHQADILRTLNAEKNTSTQIAVMV
jgi:hypothetical protein